MRIDIARDNETGENVGYCITTVSKDNLGEIDSIYIERGYRRRGIGDSLMKKALAWMDGLSIAKRVIAVASGNEEVIDFYRRFNFFPRTIILEQVENKDG